MNVEKTYYGKGGYVFVSHSHLDIARVRRIRNFLEQEGIEPILFYLRCMDSDDGEKLATLKRLIFDEIDAREFFLYVNSENAKASEWVQEELNYIRSTRPDTVASVDLSASDDAIEQALLGIVRGMRVFISASRYDEPIVARLSEALVARDFRVYDTQKVLTADDAWGEESIHTITDLAGEGFVIALLTESSVRSPYFVQEVRAAFANRVPVLPVTVGHAAAFWVVKEIPELWNICTVPLSDTPTDAEIEALLQAVVVMRERVKNGWVQLENRS